MSAKEEVIEFVRSLPDDATFPDIMTALDARFGMMDENGMELAEEEWDAAFAAEINRRVEDIRSGKAKMIPAEEVFRELREKYG